MPSDILELIHELKVHQAELSIQNDELRQAQADLSELHREFENLYEFAPCGYLALNEKGIIERANLTAVTLFGTPRRFICGSGFSRFIENGWVDVYQHARNRSLATHEKQSVDLPLKKTDGTRVWVRVDMENRLDDDGGVTQTRMVLTDITLQRQAEENNKKTGKPTPAVPENGIHRDPFRRHRP